jgi:hypothetical protein
MGDVVDALRVLRGRPIGAEPFHALWRELIEDRLPERPGPGLFGKNADVFVRPSLQSRDELAQRT